ncbi:unnamed protein product [Caretta caretta]
MASQRVLMPSVPRARDERLALGATATERMVDKKGFHNFRDMATAGLETISKHSTRLQRYLACPAFCPRGCFHSKRGLAGFDKGCVLLAEYATTPEERGGRAIGAGTFLRDASLNPAQRRQSCHWLMPIG